MSQKFDDFRDALKQLCVLHKVQLTTTQSGNLVIYDCDDDSYLIDIECMEDCTE